MGLLQRAADAFRAIPGATRLFGGRPSGGGKAVAGKLIDRNAVSVETLPDGRQAVSVAATPHHRSRVGSGGTTIYSGKLRYEEFNSELENDKGYGSYSRQGVYDKMRKTSAPIKRALWLLKLPMLAADPEATSVDDSKEELEIADIVSYNLFEQIRWHARMTEALTMFEFGVMNFEALSDVVEVPRDRFPGLSTSKGGRPKAGETVPALLFTDFEPRPAKTIYQWVARKDKPTQVAELVQWAPPTDGKMTPTCPRIPGDWLLRFTWEQEAGNFQGVSILRPLYKPWIQTDELETIDGIRHERQNCGIPVITLPQDASDDDIDKAQEFLLALASHEKAFLVLPFGWAFRWDVSGEGGGTDVGERLQHLDRRIAGGVLGDFMELGAGGTTGSFALSDTLQDRHLDLITFGARTFLEVINEGSEGWSPVRRIVDWNYGRRSRYPKVTFKNLRSKDDWAAVLPLIHNFMQAKAFGPRPTYKMAQEIVRRLNFSPNVLPPEDEFEEKPEPAPVVGVMPQDPPATDGANPPPPESDPAPKEPTDDASPDSGGESPSSATTSRRAS